ncbi:hypothetical protein O3P69_016591 [Scylla paramamosain]|uniref:Uncharacterized protein n=1 Tax=Scylla paramamosain TaxID=85552 RepID=A0AAW0SXB1_SCYPA
MPSASRQFPAIHAAVTSPTLRSGEWRTCTNITNCVTRDAASFLMESRSDAVLGRTKVPAAALMAAGRLLGSLLSPSRQSVASLVGNLSVASSLDWLYLTSRPHSQTADAWGNRQHGALGLPNEILGSRCDGEGVRQGVGDVVVVVMVVVAIVD